MPFSEDNDRAKDEFIVAMMDPYDEVHSSWIQKGYIRCESEDTTIAEAVHNRNAIPDTNTRRERSPISWWTSGLTLRGSDREYSRMAGKELIEYAARTLFVSPTAPATERAFSQLAHIQPS